MRVRLRPMLIIPSVATNGVMRPTVTMSPLARPMVAPTAKATRTTQGSAAPAFTMPAASAPATARIEPTERSMPPVRMTNVIPTAMIP